MVFDRDFPPYEYLDGSGAPAGFDIELMRAVAAAADLTVVFQPGHGRELVTALEAGRVQALAGVFRFAALERTLAFGASPAQVEFAIFTRAGAEEVQARSAVRLAGEVGLPKRYEIKIVTRKGPERWIEMAVTLTSLQGRPATVMAITDVDERRRTREVEAAIYEISRAAGASENLQELFASLHRIVARLMPAANFYIALYDAGNDLLTFPYFVDEMDARPEPLKSGRGLTGYVLRTGAPRTSCGRASASFRRS